tara:strand:- start:272 stop:871 length:600 start_codon:yes stop_codon:yes gene_type:complete
MRFLFKKRKQIFIAHKPSSEEQFIRNYLDENEIKYIAEYEIYNLKDDKKNSRRVDFYLPRLNIYLEHFGWYNKSKKVREDYDEKARVYIKNSLPTVILYPHELGFLDYALHNKIIKVLRVPKFKNNIILFRYRLNRYASYGKWYFFPLSYFVLGLTMFMSSRVNESDASDLIFGFGLATALVFFWLFFRNIIRFFFYNF